MTLGEKIKKYRELRELTQRELGQKVGFSAGTEDSRIRKYEKNMINFHTANLRPTKSLGVREPRVWLSETKRKTPECSGVSFF